MRPRSPLAELLSLALPTVMQMVSYTLMSFMDTWMLAHAGDTAATAAGGAGMFAWTLLSFGLGTLFLVNTLASQSFGRRDLPEAGRYLWQGIWLGLLYTPIVSIFTLLLPAAFARMQHGPQLLAAETTFLHIIIFANPLKLIATALGQFLVAINRPSAVLLAAASGVCVNAALAYVMVLGHLGVTSLGVRGAAIAQVCGVGTEMTVLAIIAFSPSIRISCRLNDCRLYARELIVLLRVGIPSGVQLVTEMLAWSLFQSWVLAGLGQAAMSANMYLFRFMILSFLPAIGMGSAVTALVGRHIGREDPASALRSAHLGFRVTLAYMVACGLCFFLFRARLMGIFTEDPVVLHIGGTLLVYAACYQVFDAMYCVYNGALRGAGDTTIPAIAMGGLCWTFLVFAGRLIATHHPKWGIHGPWSMATTYGISIGLFLMIRFARGRWRSIHLEAEGESSKLYGFPIEAKEV
ncbi:MAG: MATE family efflux transporter [Tepidisphaerales bacterium]